VAVDPGSRTVYVTNDADDTVSVIDASTRTVTATVPVGKEPVGVAVDPDTHTVYVANWFDGTVYSDVSIPSSAVMSGQGLVLWSRS
jgi:YVTN family beta-propeller protein